MIETIGFTGTREERDITDAQKSWLHTWLLLMYRDGARTFHHGDCVGADKIAHDLAKGLGFWTVAHPPTDERYRAFCDADEVLEAEPYLQRNRAIVDASNIVLALPGGGERLRSGTWSTIRYAARPDIGKIALGCLPDGHQFQRPKETDDES